jgi:Fe-S-cluster containining protein
VYDCQTCGVCCKAQVADLGKRVLPVLPERRCSELRGTIGQKVACAIYTTRPMACRAFEAGSQECRLMRLKMGIHA